MKKTALFAGVLFTAALAQAAVDGAITNETTGKPQGGATVTLLQMTATGPQTIETAKAGPDGRFAFTKDVQPGQGGGPLLVQVIYGGVQYNKAIAPGQTTNGVAVDVYESSNKQSDTQIAQHILVLEPDTNGSLTVDEVYMYQNTGKTTWNDAKNGTLQFQLPAGAQGKVDVEVLAPGGMALHRDASPAGKPNEFKVDFPIKPGESRIELHWVMPFKTPGVLEYHTLSKAGQTQIAAPDGITLEGDGVSKAGEVPNTRAAVYTVATPENLKLNISGTAVQQADNGGGQDNGQSNSGPGLTENLPRLFGLTVATGNMWQTIVAVKWVLLSVLGMLAIGFALLYRKGSPDSLTADASQSATSESKPRHARSRG